MKIVANHVRIMIESCRRMKATPSVRNSNGDRDPGGRRPDLRNSPLYKSAAFSRTCSDGYTTGRRASGAMEHDGYPGLFAVRITK